MRLLQLAEAIRVLGTERIMAFSRCAEQPTQGLNCSPQAHHKTHTQLPSTPITVQAEGLALLAELLPLLKLIVDSPHDGPLLKYLRIRPPDHGGTSRVLHTSHPPSDLKPSENPPCP